jgi:CBS domain-containing protein
MLVREVMTTPAITIKPSTLIHDALMILDTHTITALPVVDDRDRPIGVLSEADVLPGLVPADRRRHMDPFTPVEDYPTRVDEVMNHHPITVAPDSDLAEAVEVMTSTAVKSLPVVERGRVVGVVSRRDVIHAVARPDRDIQAEIGELIHELGRDWLIDVRNGGVQVQGPQTDAEVRLATAVASTVHGVTHVSVAPASRRPTTRSNP